MKPLYKEKNAVYKRRYSYHIGLLFPSTYQASLSSLGLQIIYYMFNNYREVYAERIVIDKTPPISIETRTPLKKFDLIIASASYELDYPIISKMLMESGLPAKREQRSTGPPIIVGGPSPTANPLPLYHLADGVLRGEMEEIMPSLIDSLTLIDDKKAFLEKLSEIKGAWVPITGTDNGISRVADLNNAFHPIVQIQSYHTEPVWGRSLLVEPSRGCNRGCLFCLEGSITRPRRERDLRLLMRIISEGLVINQLDRVAFYSLSFFDSRQGEKLLEYMIENGIKGSIPSVRADALNKEKIEMIKGIGQKIITIAPETPVKRLQLRLGKIITEKTLLNIAKWSREVGLSIKLYYMIGIPGEKEEDVEAIVSQVKKIWEIYRNRDKIRVSINPFIPKPLTGLWTNSMEDPRSLKKKLRYLRTQLNKIARVDYYNPRMAYLQYQINRAGDKAYDIIMELASKKLGSNIVAGVSEV